MKIQLLALIAIALTFKADASLPACEQANSFYNTIQNHDLAALYNDGKDPIVTDYIHIDETTHLTHFFNSLTEIRLTSMMVYNMNNASCFVEIPYTHVDDYRAMVTVDLRDIAQYSSCFKNYDTVVLAQRIAAQGHYCEISNPLLMEGKFRIDMRAKTSGLLSTQLKFTLRDDTWDSRRGFLWAQAEMDQSTRKNEIPCSLPTASDLSNFHELPVAVSEIGFHKVPRDPLTDRVKGVQIFVVPDREGCSVKSPLTIYGYDNDAFGSLTFTNCYGYAYATLINQQSPDSALSCGMHLPVKIPLNPRATKSRVFLQSAARYDLPFYDLNAGRCVENTKEYKPPVYNVQSITVKRDVLDILDTKMKSIYFTSDDGCVGVWNLKNGTAQSSETISVDELIASSKCLKAGSVVQLQYDLEDICKDSKYWIKPQARLSPGNHKDMELHFPGNRPETFLEQGVYIVDAITPKLRGN